MNRYRACIGFLRGRDFPGWRFSGWELPRFQSLSLDKLRDWPGVCSQELLGFVLETCCCSCSVIGTEFVSLDLVSALKSVSFPGPFWHFGSDFRNNELGLISGSEYVFGWPFILHYLSPPPLYCCLFPFRVQVFLSNFPSLLCHLLLPSLEHLPQSWFLFTFWVSVVTPGYILLSKD